MVGCHPKVILGLCLGKNNRLRKRIKRVLMQQSALHLHTLIVNDGILER